MDITHALNAGTAGAATDADTPTPTPMSTSTSTDAALIKGFETVDSATELIALGHQLMLALSKNTRELCSRLRTHPHPRSQPRLQIPTERLLSICLNQTNPRAERSPKATPDSSPKLEESGTESGTELGKELGTEAAVLHELGILVSFLCTHRLGDAHDLSNALYFLARKVHVPDGIRALSTLFAFEYRHNFAVYSLYVSKLYFINQAIPKALYLLRQNFRSFWLVKLQSQIQQFYKRTPHLFWKILRRYVSYLLVVGEFTEIESVAESTLLLELDGGSVDISFLKLNLLVSVCRLSLGLSTEQEESDSITSIISHCDGFAVRLKNTPFYLVQKSKDVYTHASQNNSLIYDELNDVFNEIYLWLSKKINRAVRCVESSLTVGCEQLGTGEHVRKHESKSRNLKTLIQMEAILSSFINSVSKRF